MTRAPAWVSAALLLAAAAGCGTEARTQIMVISDTDMPIPAVVDEIRFEVVAPDGTTKRARAPFTSATPPAVLGLAHADGPLGPYDITAIASVSGSDVVSRRARLSFVRERTMVLRLDLYASCVGTMCETEQTCDDSGCRSIDVAAGELTEWIGETPRLDGAIPFEDAGSMDGGPAVDGGMDGGGADGGGADGGGTDGGATDGGCTAAAECDDSLACTVDSCAMGTCEHVPDHGMCAAGDLCDSTTGCAAAPTFTDIYDGILDVTCSTCHRGRNPTGDLDYSRRDRAYTELVGVPAICAGGTNIRVVAFDAAASLLWRKVAGVDLCGAQMPFALPPLTTAEIDMIRDWINAGALDN